MKLTPRQEKLLLDFEPGRRTELLPEDLVQMRNLVRLGLAVDLDGEGKLTPEGELAQTVLTTLLHHALKRFTTEGIENKNHKATLKKAGFVEYSNGFWHLSDSGKKTAEKLGYL